MTPYLPAPNSPRHRGIVAARCGAPWPVTGLLILLWVLASGLSPQVAAASTSLARVSAIDGADIVIDAGRLDGLTVTTQVTLLREGEPIVHPLTGEVLGMPQEPVGTVHIYEVDDHSARGGLVKMYSDPLVGDLAEFKPRIEAPAPQADVEEVKKRVEQLSQSVETFRRRSESRLGTYPDFARRVLDEIGAMKSYLVSIDERMVELEEQQNENHFRLSSVLSGEYRQEDLKEFTIRYAPDTQIRLRAAGKTLMIDVVADTLHMSPVADNPPAMMAAADDGDESAGLLALLGFGDEDPPETYDDTFVDDGTLLMEEGEVPWYTSVYHLAAGVGLALALLIMVVLVIRRRYTDVMDGLDDFEEEYEGYLDDEEDEDEN